MFIEVKNCEVQTDDLYDLCVVDMETPGVKELVEMIRSASFTQEVAERVYDKPKSPTEEELKKIYKRADKCCKAHERFDPEYVGLYGDYYLTGKLPNYFDSECIKEGDTLTCPTDDDCLYGGGEGDPVLVLWAGDSRDGCFMVRDGNGHDHIAQYSEGWYSLRKSKPAQEESNMYAKYYNKGNWPQALAEIVRLKKKCGELEDGPVSE